MSFSSTPHPLNSKVENKSIPPASHYSYQQHQKNMSKYSVDQMSFSGAMRGDLSSINYLDDRKMCSLEPSPSVRLVVVLSISRISLKIHSLILWKRFQRSSSSQLFKSHYGHK